MVFIETGSTDAMWNLACEEYVLSSLPFDDVLMLWQNKCAVIVGRYQIAEAEVDQNAVDSIGAQIVRRISGGGAVYHDPGNINYSFIIKESHFGRDTVREKSMAVTSALNGLGIPAVFQGRNDILVEGKKVSGTAQAYLNSRILHHGTLLFNTDLDVMEMLLNVNPRKYEGRRIESLRSRVTNMSEHFKGTIETFTHKLKSGLFAEKTEIYDLTAADRRNIGSLAESKYARWEWNFGESPDYNFENSVKTPFGIFGLRLNIQSGHIQTARIFGDFLGRGEPSPLERALTGVRFERRLAREAIESLDVESILGGIGGKSLLDCMFG